VSRPGVRVVLVGVVVLAAVVVVGANRIGSDLAPRNSAPLDSGPPALSTGERELPIVHFGDRGWLIRTLTVVSELPSADPLEVVVELRFVWTNGVGHVRIVGSGSAERVEEVITDEIRSGAALEASIEQLQRMFDELRETGGSIEMSNGVTVARQRMITPDGEAADVWRIGVGDPHW